MLNRLRGFTLIELMITVAVIGVLATIAYSSYEGSVRKAKRRSAQAFMMDAATKEQQVFLDRRSFLDVGNNAAFPGTLNISVPADIAQYYTFEVEVDRAVSGSACADAAAAPPDFCITATPSGTQTSDGVIVLDSTGAKAPADKW